MKKIQYSLHQFQLVSLICAKATPHNSSAALAMPFSPSAACRFLDLPPVNLRNLQLHLTKNSFATAPTHLCGVALEILRKQKRENEKATQSSDKKPAVVSNVSSNLHRTASAGETWRCEKCGTVNDSTSWSCKDCGNYR